MISWNVEGRVRTTLERQLRALLERDAEVVALQELTVESFPHWERGLTDAGYSVISSVELIARPYPPPPFPTDWFHRGRAPTTQLARKNFLVASFDAQVGVVATSWLPRLDAALSSASRAAGP